MDNIQSSETFRISSKLVRIFLIGKFSLEFEEDTKIVSDEDKAIIGAVKSVFPEVVHSFCVFHQLKNVNKRYSDEFGSVKSIPDNDKLVYNEICQLIQSDTVINSVVCFQNILNLASNLELSKASQKAISYAKEIFEKNISFLKKGFTPETDNTMEQIFSLIGDIVEKARSFKTDSGLTNFCYNCLLISTKGVSALENGQDFGEKPEKIKKTHILRFKNLISEFKIFILEFKILNI